MKLLLGLIVRGWDLFELCVNSGFYCGLTLMTLLLAEDVGMLFWLVLIRLVVGFTLVV